MFAQSDGGWIGGVTALVGLLAALLGVLRYFNYRTRRDRIKEVGTAFESVVDSLASENDVKRLAAAIRLRRFYDPHSEVGAAGAAYAVDALTVSAGILREQPTGNFQKLLADGLGHARSLIGADLQRTNLQSAYLGGVDVSGADFYRADLSHASLKRAVARGTVFYESRLVHTVFGLADLRDANFYRADLSHATFVGSRLTGANFGAALGVPEEIAAHLDPDGRFAGPDEPLAAPEAPTGTSKRIFVSRPSVLTAPQEAMWRVIDDILRMAGAEPVTIARSDYPPAGVLAEVRGAMTTCSGVVIVGFRQLEVAAGRWRAGTAEERDADGLALSTPWNHVEAGMAAALSLPVFVIREPGLAGGVFDLVGDVVTVVADFDDAIGRADASSSLRAWLRRLVA